MANRNGETFAEIRELLKQDVIDQRVAMRLLLASQADLYDKLETYQRDNQNEHGGINYQLINYQSEQKKQHLEISSDMTLLKKKNIWMWIEGNKPIALLLGALLLIVVYVAPDLLARLAAKIFGVPLP